MNVIRKILPSLLLIAGMVPTGSAQGTLNSDNTSFGKKLDSIIYPPIYTIETKAYIPDSIPTFHYTAEAYPVKELDKNKFWSKYPVYEIPLVYPSSDYPVYTLPLVDPSKVYPVYEIPLVNYSEVYPVHDLFDTIKYSEWPDSIMIFHELKSIELKKKEKPKKGKRFKKLPPNKN